MPESLHYRHNHRDTARRRSIAPQTKLQLHDAVSKCSAGTMPLYHLMSLTIAWQNTATYIVHAGKKHKIWSVVRSLLRICEFMESIWPSGFHGWGLLTPLI